MRRITKLPLAMLAAVLGFGAVATPAAAQCTAAGPGCADATANVTATIVGVTPITVTKNNDLDFGTVFVDISAGAPPTTATVPDVDAARFTVTGQTGAAVTVSFTLPAVLTETVGGTETISISFATDDGLLWGGAGSFPGTGTPAATFNPNSPATGAGFTLNGTGTLIVGLNGTITADATTVSGDYAGEAIITVEYN